MRAPEAPKLTSRLAGREGLRQQQSDSYLRQTFRHTVQPLHHDTQHGQGIKAEPCRLLGSATQDTESCRCCKESTTLPQESYRRIDVEKVGRLWAVTAGRLLVAQQGRHGNTPEQWRA